VIGFVNRLAIKISKRWLDKNIIDADTFECYVYGLEIILQALLGIFNVLLIAIYTNTSCNAVVFLIAFISIRQFTGGYHANTFLKCNMYFLLAYLINIFLTFNLKIGIELFAVVTTVIGLSVIWKAGVIDNPKKRLNKNQKKRNKNKALFLYAFCCMTSILFIKVNVHIAMTINIALLEIVVLMISAKRQPSANT